MSEAPRHIPVMLDEVLELLAPSPGKNFLDCTLGGAGHAKAILEKTAPDGKLYGLDRDPYAIERSKSELSEFKNRFFLFHGEFSRVEELISEEIFATLDGVLIDCGVSSFQLDSQDRGFSFRFDSPLDMRMNTQSGLSAKDFLKHIDERELADVIYQLGEERNSRKIAKNIVTMRNQGKLNTTFDLVEAVTQAFPPRHYYKTHPATKTFQALRMKINGELDEIETCLRALLNRLKIGSKIVVITFHSLEDRLVKNIFRNAYKAKRVRLLTKKPIAASREESKENPRARSAKVRAIELLAYEE